MSVTTVKIRCDSMVTTSVEPVSIVLPSPQYPSHGSSLTLQGRLITSPASTATTEAGSDSSPSSKWALESPQSDMDSPLPFKLPSSLFAMDSSDEEDVTLVQPEKTGFSTRFSLTVDEEDEVESETSEIHEIDVQQRVIDPSKIKNLKFRAIVESINAGEDRYVRQARSVDTSNMVHILYDTIDACPVAVFKTTKSARDCETVLGTGSGTQFAFQNEIISSNLSSLVSNRAIVPAAEIVTLQHTEGEAPNIKINYQTGTMHEYIDANPVPTLGQIKQNELHVLNARTQSENAADSESALVYQERYRGLSHELEAKRTTLSAFEAPSAPDFDSTIQDIAALQIITVSLDVNVGNVMMDKTGAPVSIDYNEIAPIGLEQGIKPPCWMRCDAANVPYVGNTKLASLTHEEIVQSVTEVDGYSEDGLNVIASGYSLLKTGIAKGLSLNEMADFLIGYRYFENSPRQEPALKCIHDACAGNSTQMEAYLSTAMDHVVANRAALTINYSALGPMEMELAAEKKARQLLAFCQDLIASNPESYVDSAG